MAEYVPVPNTVQVEMRQTLDGEPIENTLYFLQPTAWTVAEMEGLALVMIDWWDDAFSANLSHQLVLDSAYLTDLASQTGPTVSMAPATTVTGKGADEAMANNVAPCISFHTGSRGKSFRGRNYIAGIGTGAINQSRFIAEWGAGMAAAYMALLPLAAAQTATWVVVSRFSGVEIVAGKRKPIPRAVGLATPILSASFTDNVADSQRGRLPNH